MTSKDKAQIPLPTVHPLVLRSSFQNDAPPFHDNLELTKRMNGALREMSARGRVVRLIFVDASEFPEAYSLAGRYRVDEGQVTVKVYLLRGTDTVGQFTVEGNLSTLNQLTRDILKETEKQISILKK